MLLGEVDVYLSIKINVYLYRFLIGSRGNSWDETTSCYCDLDLELMTFIDELHLYPLKMNLKNKIELSTSRLSETIVLHTDRQM